MTDYNDGKWHGWNGGECPVHELSVVDFFAEKDDWFFQSAGNCDWEQCGGFRVTKPYIEPPKPREFWIAGYIAYGHDRCGGIHVREVTE